MRRIIKGISVSVLTFIMVFAIVAPNEQVFAAGKPGKVPYSSIKATKIKYYSMSLEWKKGSNAKEYKVAFRYNSKQRWRYVTTKSTSATLKNIEPNINYKVKIQSIRGLSKSDWTKTKTFKTKKSPYTKVYHPKAKTNRHLVPLIEGGWVPVTTSTHIKEYYRYKGKYKEFGYRCYGVIFSSKAAKELTRRLYGHAWAVRHYTAYNQSGKTKYKKKTCNVHRCMHAHIYGGDKFDAIEKDSTSVVSHKKGSSGYILINYSILGEIPIPPNKDVKFSGVAK